MKLIESIPNISEGRDKNIIEEIVNQVRETEGCVLMDYSSDIDHNRSVITYMGTPEAVEKASIKIVKKSVELIDLRNHKGAHPRMGAVDVMPFVPIKNVTMEECIELSKRVGEKIYEELKVPVYLYEKSTDDTERKNLANIRKGGFENFNKKILEDKWKPDFGKRKIHQTAGVIAVGARKTLIAYNVKLDTSDVSIAKKISEKIREKNGGLKCVKAIGIMLESENKAQVSMNLTDYTVTPPHIAVEAIKKEAKKYNVEILSSELIGLMPMRALIDAGAKYLKLENFTDYKQIIEEHILEIE